MICKYCKKKYYGTRSKWCSNSCYHKSYDRKRKKGWHKKYYEPHPIKKNKKTPEEWKEYRKKYYQENKKKILEGQKRYNNANREKVTKMMNDYRKRKAQEYKEQGQMYCFLSKTERETKMIEKLAYKKHISLELSRELLMKNDWNIKKLLIEEVVYNA